MSIWAVAPSIRSAGGTLPEWYRKGYYVAALRQGAEFPECHITILTEHYQGWGRSINILIRTILDHDPEARWFVVANDDTLPDPHSPVAISIECERHFLRASHGAEGGGVAGGGVAGGGATFGLMQPIGDLAAWPGSRIDTFAGSPWIGRAFARRAYGGRGPVPECYIHSFGDQELQEVAQRLGVYWQRPDLCHRHDHALRSGGEWPEFMRPLVTPQAWREARDLFTARRQGGFAEGMKLL